MKSPLAPRRPRWVEPRLFPVQYTDLVLGLAINLSSQEGMQYVRVTLHDALRDDELIAMSAQPVGSTKSLEELHEVLADALKMALEHLTPFPPG